MKCERICLYCISMIFAAVTLWGQGITSRVVGTVTDPSGAVVAVATVTLTNQETNVSYRTTTTSTGTYVFEAVPVGTYAVAVEKAGFNKFTSSGNLLTIGQPMTVNAQLQVGAVTQTVEVTGAAQLVQTSTSGNFGNLVNRQAIQELPIVGTRGRNPLNFVLFQPGVVNCLDCTGGGINVNGTRDRAWNYTLDGVDANDTSAGGSNSSPTRTNPDMLSEFRVLTSNFTAEFGRSPGADVLMVTRSGSNQFHGEGFEFYQTPRLEANQWYNNEQVIPKVQFVQHIYGFSVGGPIRKDKTFFFANMQFLHAHQSQLVTSNVYTPTARQGIFRYVVGGRNGPAGSSNASVDSNGNVLPGKDIGTYDIGANDPAKLGLDPSVQKVLGLTPSPNNFTVGDGLNIAGYSFNAPDQEQQVEETLRFDHVFNDRHTVFVRWYGGHEYTIGDVVNAGLRPFPTAPDVVDTYRNPRNLAVGWRWIPTPQSTNELLLGMNRFTYNFANPDPNYRTNPEWVLNNVTMPLQNYYGNLRALTTLQVVDNYSYVFGAHTLKTGINLRVNRHIDRRGSVGPYDIQPLATMSTSVDTVDPAVFSIPGNVNSSYDLPTLQNAVNDLLGRIGDIQQGFVASGNQWAPAGTVFPFQFYLPEYDFYGQDSWKIRPNLTADIGLRWEINPPPSDPRGRIARPSQCFVVGCAPTDQLNWTKGDLYSTTWGDLGPSIGLAWDVTGKGKTSIRANYRLAYDRLNTFILSSSIFQNLPGANYAVDYVDFGQSGGRISQGIPVISPGLVAPGLTPSQLTQPPAFSTASTTVMSPYYRPAKVNEWGLGIEHALTQKMVLSVNYIGNHGVGLFSAYNANQVNIFNNGFLDAFNIVKAGGDSPLMDQLMANYPGASKYANGSAAARSIFKSDISLNSVAHVAQTLATKKIGGQSLVVADGLSPFFFMNDPQFAGGLNVLHSDDYSSYNALQVILQRRMSQNLNFQVSYTYAKALGLRYFDPTFSVVRTGALQSASTTPFDIHNRNLNYARENFDRRHSLQGYWVWGLPFGHGMKWGSSWNSVLDKVLGGWGSSGILTLQSGGPLTVYSGAYTYSNVVQSPAACVSGCSEGMLSLQSDPSNGNLYLLNQNQRAQLFSNPGAGQLGLSRNFFNKPSLFNLDLTIDKRIYTTEHQNLELRLEMTNALNHPNFDEPDSSQITSSVFARERGGPYNGARQIQVALKYYF